MNDPHALELLIDRLVTVEKFSSQQVSLLPLSHSDLDLKIALLSFILEELRYRRNADCEPVTFENYVRCGVSVKNDSIVITSPEKYESIGSGTDRRRFQSPLLLFLLIHHRERHSVLDIIQLFIEKIRVQLTFLDFKKTETGVTRCFTNTRFAARVLREYGLLKFTHREAFKTWELSLTGLLVATTILGTKRQQSHDIWTLPPANKESHFDLSPEIRNALDSISSFEAFVARLSSVCGPKAHVFQTFGPALSKAYAVLGEYGAILKNSKLKQKERKAASAECILQLEQGGISEDFYTEFSACIKSADELTKT